MVQWLYCSANWESGIMGYKDIEILGYLLVSLILEYDLLSHNLMAKNRGFTALQSAKVAIVDS